MFQSFEVTARPEQGPPRLAALRDELAHAALDGFLIPRADAHQGEYVSARDERLAWLTGFTGSAGFCAALRDVAGVFIDGRYRTQVKDQVADVFTPVPWPENSLATWLKDQLPNGGQVGFDPWLHTVAQIEQARATLEGTNISLVDSENLVDRIWEGLPAPAQEAAKEHPIEFAGESNADKRTRLGIALHEAGHEAAVITLPDSICWLLNIRGADIPRNPIAQGFAVLMANGSVDLFMMEHKLHGLEAHLGPEVRVHAPDDFLPYLSTLNGPVRLDKTSVPVIVAQTLGDKVVWGEEPCALPKACKNAAEINGSAQAHLRDGAAVVELLAWLDAQAPNTVSETQVVSKLEAFRRRDNALQDISFETIAGTGPNGAIMHYRVTTETDSQLQDGHLIVLDSGGQYLDGTTDITRTIAIGTPNDEARSAFTRVLLGMIAISRLRWPLGLAGRDIEAIGRAPLWMAGQDFDHGLGHGVGAYLSVHEGPQRLSRISHVPLQAGMILSNEPGYYREGAFGIRIENLIVVEDAPELTSGDAHRAMLNWRTLTFAPIDRRLIDIDLLDADSLAWLNAYHAETFDKIGPRVAPETKEWLRQATRPL
ncbi:MAG: aminopeptidase P family protein [Ascidiaceihabitans sp.]|nr:aminopeptidase P family protein [Ascidiaceihabitans sp.]